MAKAELRKRVERFSSLQAAQRALARSVHPSHLAPVREQSRALLIQLQALSSEAPADGDDALVQIDRALDAQAQRTLTILEGVDLAQLRATVPMLAQQHRDEVCGLVDVLLAGDLEADKILRTIEYLITMLAAEESGGRRTVVCDPSEVTPRLRQASQRLLQATNEGCRVAERALRDATSSVRQDGEIGEVRDRIRHFKRDLGSGLLHPGVLAAAVEYNVAMWNQVAAEIDSSRSIEALAEGLFVADDAPARPATATTARAPELDALGSEGFAKLVAAVRTRVEGSDDGSPAGRIAAALPLDSLRAEDVEAFAGEDADEATWLMRAAVVAGLVLGAPPALDGPLAELGVDRDLLRGRGLDDLIDRMSALSRKRFAESNYGEAFRLSDVKTHNLSLHTAKRGGASSGDRGRSTPPPRAKVESEAPPTRPTRPTHGWLSQLLHALPGGPLMLVVLGLLALLLMPGLGEKEPDGEAVLSDQERLAQISPFLEWGRETDGMERWVGRVGPTWDYLGTPERNEVANQIGSHFASQGTSVVVLTDAQGDVVARYEYGDLSWLEPRTAP